MLCYLCLSLCESQKIEVEDMLCIPGELLASWTVGWRWSLTGDNGPSLFSPLWQPALGHADMSAGLEGYLRGVGAAIANSVGRGRGKGGG